MKNYVIIDEEVIQKRIKELEELYKNSEKPSIQGTVYNKLSHELKKILSQTTPLIPKIEESFMCGAEWGYDTALNDDEDSKVFENVTEYISNLNLDI